MQGPIKAFLKPSSAKVRLALPVSLTVFAHEKNLGDAARRLTREARPRSKKAGAF
jgi:heme exporter protein D